MDTFERDEYVNAIHEREREIELLRYDLKRAKEEIQHLRDTKFTIAEISQEYDGYSLVLPILRMQQTSGGICIIVGEGA